jgi:hypothetical protein
MSAVNSVSARLMAIDLKFTEMNSLIDELPISDEAKEDLAATLANLYYEIDTTVAESVGADPFYA